MSEKTTEKANEKDVEDKIQHIESQIADAMGMLDAIISHPQGDSVDQTLISALNTKLRHLEMKRHHLASQESQEEVYHHMLQAIGDAGEAFDAILKQYRRIERNPNHVHVSFGGMGLRIEASGREDDPLFQQVATTIKSIGEQMSSLKETTIKSQLEEERLEREHVRDLQNQPGFNPYER